MAALKPESCESRRGQRSFARRAQSFHKEATSRTTLNKVRVGHAIPQPFFCFVLARSVLGKLLVYLCRQISHRQSRSNEASCPFSTYSSSKRPSPIPKNLHEPDTSGALGLNPLRLRSTRPVTNPRNSVQPSVKLRMNVLPE